MINLGQFLPDYSPWLSPRWDTKLLPSPRNHTDCVRFLGEFWPGRNHYTDTLGPARDLANLVNLTEFMPNIKTLDLLACSFRGDLRNQSSFSLTSCALNLSCLRHFHLSLCTLTRDRLIQLLENCPSLTMFSHTPVSSTSRLGNHRLCAPLIPSKSPTCFRTDALTSATPPVALARALPRPRVPIHEHLRPSEQSNGAPRSLSRRQWLVLLPNDDQDPATALPAIFPPNIEYLEIVEAREWTAEVSDALIHLLETVLAGQYRFDMLWAIRVTFSPEYSFLEYMSGKAGDEDLDHGGALGYTWAWRHDSVGSVLSPRVAELAAEAGIELYVEEAPVYYWD